MALTLAYSRHIGFLPLRRLTISCVSDAFAAARTTGETHVHGIQRYLTVKQCNKESVMRGGGGTVYESLVLVHPPGRQHIFGKQRGGRHYCVTSRRSGISGGYTQKSLPVELCGYMRRNIMHLPVTSLWGYQHKIGRHREKK